MTANAKTPKSLGPCTCSLFDFDVWIDDTEGTYSDGYETGCTEKTKRDFAQGHDAKLAGFLTRAELANHEIRRCEGGIAICYSSAVDAAMKISEAFAAKVAKQIEAAQNRLAKKAERAAKKAPKTEAKPIPDEIKAPTSRKATIKIGRWTYEATVAIHSGTAIYRTKSGDEKIVEQGQYTEVN